MKRLLLHVCCGPCSTTAIQRMIDAGYDVTLFFYNPNIHPIEEFKRRLLNAEKASERLGVNMIEAEYNPDEYFSLVKGLEDEPEGGRRCERCYELRIRKTMEYAKEHGFDSVTTTITISPHHNSDIVNAIGEKLSKEICVEYLSENFKKKDGFLNSINLSKEFGLYRQDYCGCIFSLKEAETRRKSKPF